MPAPIPEKALKKIAECIRNWPKNEKLTWNSVCQASKLYLDYVPTRQALSSKHLLSFEYKSKKRDISASSQTTPSRPKNMDAAIQKIQNLERNLATVEQQNSLLHEMIQRMIYNSALHKISKSELLKEIPSPTKHPSMNKNKT